MTHRPQPVDRGLVVGLGSIGRRHLANLRALRPDMAIWALRRTGTESPDPTVPVVGSLDEALAVHPQVAILASPAPCHVTEALALAKAGVHLLVEKPLSDRLEGVADLLDTCRRRGVVLMTGYTLRFAPSLMALKEALPRIGRILSVRAEVGQYLPDWRPGTDYRQGVTARPELGGGAALELSHEFDTLRWLLGEVSQVCALSGSRGDLDLPVEDLVEALLTFRSGVFGSVHLDLLQRVPTRTCRILGTEGTLLWDGIAHGLRLFTQGAWIDLVRPDDPPFDRNRMYVDELAHFLACVEDGLPPKVTGEDGLRALEIALAAKASQGRTLQLGMP